jgi:hypothetical protein
MQKQNLSPCNIEEMLDYAWEKAIKYRFDPVAGRIHEEYLDMLKSVKKKNDSDKKTL